MPMQIIMGTDFAARADAVLAKLCSCAECDRAPEHDLSASFCFRIKRMDGDRARPDRFFFIPKPLHRDGYTQAQLAEIEATVAAFDIDLMPLDYALLN